MKRLLSLVLAASVLTAMPAHAAAISAGQKCTKVNQKSTSGAKSFICTKSGSKLVWKALPAPTPKPTTAPAAAAPTTDPNLTGLWAKYSWKNKTRDAVITASTTAFTSYVATKRSPNQVVTVLAQDGVDPMLKKWVQDGATLVAQSFAYPALKGPFYDVIAIDSAWLAKTYLSVGVSQQEVDGKVGAFNAGAPAFGGTTNNTWNMTSITNNRLMINDKAGMAQTAGHEFYHAIQENMSKRNPGADGAIIPNWVWEGPATFVGLQAAAKIGAIDYTAEGRKAFIERYNNGNPINRTSALIEIKANDGKVDPYALGFAASELLVANVGIEKFNAIYSQLGEGKSFADAFQGATGVLLTDFYSMFEEVRGELGFPKS